MTLDRSNRVVAAFDRLHESQSRGLMPFVCGGHPTLESTAPVIDALCGAGASIIEVGIPFSDPIADGPVIAAAMHEALVAGVTPALVFEQVASVRSRVSAGLVAMISVSLVYRLGGSRGFASMARQAGFDGLIVPDCPLEESHDLIESCAREGLTLSLLISPTTPQPRAATIAQACTGFAYLLARTGITGERQDLPDVERPVQQLREASTIPIACGFGISNAEQVAAIVRHADAAIVGSAMVRRLSEAAKAGRDPAVAGAEFARMLSQGLVTPQQIGQG